MSMAWCRLWHDMPTDPKWRTIAKKSGQRIGDVMAVYNFILVNASANATERGRTHNLFADDLATALDLNEADIEAILDAMQGKVLNGDLVSGWEKRQPKREDSSAERAKAWRERNRTQPNAKERSDTDTDTDTEEDKDKDKDKDKEKKKSKEKKENSSAPSELACEWFQDFWECYPPRNGKKLYRAETLSRFSKLSPADQDLCVQAVKHYANSDLVRRGMGIKDPPRFIRDGKGQEPWREWMDPEIQTIPQNSKTQRIQAIYQQTLSQLEDD